MQQNELTGGIWGMNWQIRGGTRHFSEPSRDLLTTSSALRWYLLRQANSDEGPDEFLEYQAAEAVLHEFESHFPGLRSLVEDIEEVAKLATGVRLAKQAEAPLEVTEALEEELELKWSSLGRRRQSNPWPDVDRLLTSYAGLVSLSGAASRWG